MSLHLVKSFSRPLSLISAALLLHIGGAMAADAAGDVQQHAPQRSGIPAVDDASN